MISSKAKKVTTTRTVVTSSQNDKSVIQQNSQTAENIATANSATDIALLLNQKEDEE